MPDLVDDLADLLAQERGKVRQLEREAEAMRAWALWLAERVVFLETSHGGGQQ